MKVMKSEPTLDEILKKPWWTVDDVRVYLGVKTRTAARQWMYRKNVRRCRNRKMFTCRDWVDAALDGKG